MGKNHPLKKLLAGLKKAVVKTTQAAHDATKKVLKKQAGADKAKSKTVLQKSKSSTNTKGTKVNLKAKMQKLQSATKKKLKAPKVKANKSTKDKSSQVLGKQLLRHKKKEHMKKKLKSALNQKIADVLENNKGKPKAEVKAVLKITLKKLL